FSVVVVSTNRVADGVLASGLGLSCAWSAGKTAARIKNTPSVIRVRLIFPSWNFRQIENVLPDARSIQILVRCGRIEQLDLELVDLQPGDLYGLLIILRCGSPLDGSLSVGPAEQPLQQRFLRAGALPACP